MRPRDFCYYNQPLRQSYLADAFLQFGEVVHGTARLKTIIIQCKAFDDVFFKALRGPDAELRALRRLYAVAHRDDDIEIIIFKFPLYLSFTFLLNCSEFPNSCGRDKFSFLEHILNVLTYSGF